MQRSAEQRGSQETVLAVADIDEDGGKGRRDQERLRTRQDGAQGREIGGEADNQPDRQSEGIGNCGDGESHRKEERRIVPAVERHLAPVENRLLGPMLKLGLIGLGGTALPGQRARGIDIGKVGAERLAVAVDQAVRRGDPAGKGERADDEQDQAVAAHARRCKPLSGMQGFPEDVLPEMSQFRC